MSGGVYGLFDLLEAEAIDTLTAENKRLRAENRFLDGTSDHGYGAEEG